MIGGMVEFFKYLKGCHIDESQSSFLFWNVGHGTIYLRKADSDWMLQEYLDINSPLMVEFTEKGVGFSYCMYSREFVKLII